MTNTFDRTKSKSPLVIMIESIVSITHQPEIMIGNPFEINEDMSR